MKPTIHEVMAEVAKLETAETPLERACARSLVAVAIGKLFGLTPHEAIAALQKPALRLVKVNEVPWFEGEAP